MSTSLANEQRFIHCAASIQRWPKQDKRKTIEQKTELDFLGDLEDNQKQRLEAGMTVVTINSRR